MCNNPKSLITRLYGLHSIQIQNDVVIYVLVMGNLFNTKLKIHEKYDIKVTSCYSCHVIRVIHVSRYVMYEWSNWSAGFLGEANGEGT